MKKAVFTLILLAIFCGSIIAEAQNKDDIEAIKEVVQTAYVDGVHNLGDISDIEKGFHPGFIMFSERDNHLNKFPIYTWLEYVKQRKKENPNGPAEKSTVNFLMVEATGNTGIVKIELHRGSKVIYTDCFLLLKFNEGWRIVAKIYHQHK